MKRVLHFQVERRKRLSRDRLAQRRLSRGKNKVCLDAIKAPETLCINNHKAREETLRFIERIRRLASMKPGKITLDFRRTKKMISGGMLLICAELHYIKAVYRGIYFKGIPPRSQKCTQVFSQVGLSTFLHMPMVSASHEDVVYWRSAHGDCVDGQRYDEVLGPYSGALTDALQSNIYRGMIEAMNNAVQHAYEDDRADGLPQPGQQFKTWWMFSQEKDGRLSVVICDLGIGIPRSLPIRHGSIWSKLIAGLKAPPTDAMAIEAAVEVGKSRMETDGRGKGIADILDTVATEPSGICGIYSNSGLLMLQDGRMTRYNYDASILGTLIYWNMPLKKS